MSGNLCIISKSQHLPRFWRLDESKAQQLPTQAAQHLTIYRCCWQAAAHGVPTVATKNGGPVDIMSTLHHGLLVDPANSNDIANACFKLLTNSSMWDQMSHNGA